MGLHLGCYSNLIADPRPQDQFIQQDQYTTLIVLNDIFSSASKPVNDRARQDPG